MRLDVVASVSKIENEIYRAKQMEKSKQLSLVACGKELNRLVHVLFNINIILILRLCYVFVLFLKVALIHVWRKARTMGST
jgi:hypothetical protein